MCTFARERESPSNTTFVEDCPPSCIVVNKRVRASGDLTATLKIDTIITGENLQQSFEYERTHNH